MMCRSITKETRINRNFNHKVDETGEKAINLLVQHLEDVKRIAFLRVVTLLCMICSACQICIVHDHAPDRVNVCG